jgi:hypothetical protein
MSRGVVSSFGGVMLLSLIAAQVGAAAEETAVNRIVVGTGCRALLEKFDVLELSVADEETRANGNTSQSSYRIELTGGKLEHARVEQADGLTLVRTEGSGWAAMNGQLDQRPQTPAMAAGTVAVRVFPLMLPCSLGMDGVQVDAVSDATLEGKPVWKLDVSFPKGFFANPIMGGKWQVWVAKADYAPLQAEFQPPIEFAREAKVGIRYRYLKTARVGGCLLPSYVLAEGVDTAGVATGQNRVSKVTAAVRGGFDPTLFVRPDLIQALDGEE